VSVITSYISKIRVIRIITIHPIKETWIQTPTIKISVEITITIKIVNNTAMAEDEII
jgi:hypothetical protein